MAFKPDEAKLGPAPTGSDGPSYTQMLSSLFEEIRKAVKGDGKEAWIRELKGHRINIGEEITKNDAMVAKMEKEENSKITSEGLHEGFNTSVPSPAPPTFHICLTLGARCQTVYVDETPSHRNKTRQTQTKSANHRSPQPRNPRGTRWS
jgi:hypothetical protein